MQLLTSPLFAGTSSAAQRWRKATARKRVLKRDGLYWVPLFLITMGVRPEEILQLQLKDTILRDRLLCLMLGEENDSILKNEQSRRILPIPQILLDLGFREWIVSKLGRGEFWAFPEIQPDASHDRRSQTFGDRMRSLLNGLKLKCEKEDIYAMRRTLSSKLLHLRIETGTRQRILGHLEGTTVDRHYSDHGLAELKDILVSVDYGIEIGRVPEFAFPIVVGCNTPILPQLDVEIALGEKGSVSALRLQNPDTE